MYPRALVVLFFAVFLAATVSGAPLKQFKLKRGDATGDGGHLICWEFFKGHEGRPEADEFTDRRESSPLRKL